MAGAIARVVRRSCVAVCALACATAAAAQTGDEAKPYVVRGRQTEARQKAWHERVQRFYDALSATLRTEAPDLLARLDPPPRPDPSGYQVLPKLLPDPPPPAPGTVARIVSYYWGWSDTLIARETTTLERLETGLAQAARDHARAGFETLVTDYRALAARRVGIDADVQYNWLWQAAIDRDRAGFDRLNALQALVLERQTIEAAVASRDEVKIRSAASARGLDTTPMIEDLRDILVARAESIAWDIAAATTQPAPADWVAVDHPSPGLHVVSVPFYTDITDASFVEAFRNAIEGAWQARSGADEYRMRLAITTITPQALYCPGQQPPGCALPAEGAAIDLDTHVARFPAGAAVLTTGARVIRLTGSALVVSPYDIAPRVLAHEFGHMFGFPDTYRRGYRNLGNDGYAATELADGGDIMGMPATGPVLPRHFEELIAAIEVRDAMAAGLSALYTRNNPNAAVANFRDVLARRPTHFGATLQLAKALDAAGRPDDALAVWKRVLEAAEAINDAETTRLARERVER